MFELNQKLKKTDEKFKILFELSPIGMALVDHKTGKILEVNQTLLDATGYTKDEFLSLFFSDIIPEKYYYQEKQQLKDLKKKGKFGPNEKEYIRKDGTFCPVKINGFSFVDMDGSKVVWVLIEDITVTKQYELIYQDQKELLEYIAVEKKLQKILDKIVFLSEKRTPGTKCSILLVDESGEHLINGSAPSLPKFYNDAINGVAIGEKVGSCGSAAFKKQRVIVGNIDTHKNWQSFLALTQKANLHACWSEPIISSDNQILGTFAIYSSEPKAPCEFELKLIETYANIASKAIEKHNYTKHIKESQIELEQLFNNSYSGLLYLDENRTIIKVNKRFADMMGYDNADEFVGMSAESLHLNHERYLEFGKKRFYTLITNLGNFNIEYQLKRKDGSALWCELSGKALDAKVPADLSKGVLWTVNDISLRKKYEKQLNEKQLQLKNILVTIPDMVWLKDSKGVHMICNPAYETFFSASNKEIIGKTDYDLVDKKMADFFKSTDEKAMGSKDVITYEKWLECVDNNKKVLFEVSKKAMRNTQGEILGVLGIGHDVTQRKLREEKLQELNALAKSLTKEQQNLLSLFDKGDSVLFKWRNDKDWSVEYVSKSVKKLLGLSQKKFQKTKKPTPLLYTKIMCRK